MADSCSHWWHAPLYIAMSATLVFIFINTSIPSHRRHNSTQTPPLLPSTPTVIKLSINNATQSLRSNGFTFIATLLHFSPQLFLSTPQSTLFAIQDSTLSNLSLSPPLLQQLLLYHTLPTRYSMNDLLQKPVNTCFPTYVPLKNLAITKVGEGRIEINNVLVSHPDLFLDGPISIHGVDKPFALFDSLVNQESNGDGDIAQSPVCGPSNRTAAISIYDEIKKRNEWRRVVQVLSVNGFVPFAIALHSVFNDILENYRDLNSVTIFAPPSTAIPALPSPLLERFVKFHIIPQSLSFKELASMTEDSAMRTLVPDKVLVITKSMDISQILAINGVEITAPDIFCSKKFTVHGISRAFGMGELSGLLLD